MIQRCKEWLLETMAIAEITGMKPENINFCVRISGPDGKGVLAKRLGITHMVDDHDEALKAVYDAQTEEGTFPHRGQFFHFARSGIGSPPSCDKWRKEDRPPGVHAVNSWKDVMHLLNVQSHRDMNPLQHTPTRATQYRLPLPVSCTVIPPSGSGISLRLMD